MAYAICFGVRLVCLERGFKKTLIIMFYMREKYSRIISPPAQPPHSKQNRT